MEVTIDAFLMIQQAIKEIGAKNLLRPGTYNYLKKHKDDKYFIMAFFSGLQASIDEDFDISPMERFELMENLTKELPKAVTDLKDYFKDIDKESVNKEEES